jgi:hypothetical protein
MKKATRAASAHRPRTTPTDKPAIVPVESPECAEDGEADGFDEAVVDALGIAAVVGEYEPGIGGLMVNAGEKWVLLEFESSVILNLYCWVVGTSAGIRRVALPLLGRTAGRRKGVSNERNPNVQRSRKKIHAHIPVL